jgi:hypothetical protein
MTEKELKEAIQHPIQQHPDAKGRRFEQALLDKLATDAAADAAYLPLLQVTLEDLWAKGTLNLYAYGTLTDAIRQRAEQVYTASLDGTPRTPDEQQAVMQTFLDLVEVSLDDDARRDVRRRRTVAELMKDRPEWERTIDELVTARLLSKGLEQRAGREVEVVDIVHESLIGNWDLLRDAIGAQRNRLQQRVRFELTLEEWQAHNQSDAYLLTGVRLAEAETLDQQGDVALHSSAAQELLKRSRGRREKERQKRIRNQRRVITALSLLLLLALGATWFAFDRQQAAVNEARRASHQLDIATSRQLALQAQKLVDDNEPEAALLLGLEAVDIISTNEVQSFLLSVLQTNLPTTYFHGYSNQIQDIAFSPDGQTLASANENGTIAVLSEL